MAFAPGMLLGDRYELRRQVSSDGMTEEWAATDRVLARAVVVETLAPGGSAEPFVAAAAAAARLVHPGIVATYDTGVVAGLPYVITERPGGATLAELIEAHGAMPAARVLVVGRQLAQSLVAAHRSGVVHGGVSVHTVTVGDDDRVKLGRFASWGARAAAGSATGPAGDVRDLVHTLREALGGSGGSPLRPVLDAAEPGGSITTAAELSTALDAIEVVDDRTPPLGTPPTVGSRNGMVAGIIVGLLLVGAIAATAFALVSNGGGGGAGGSGAGASGGGRGGDFAVAAVHSFNPFGDTPDKTENEQLVGHLIEHVIGGTTTVWSTSEYKTQKFGNLKPGTGVYLKLDSRHTLHQLTVTTPVTGWTFSVCAADNVPTDLAGWGQPIAGPVTASANVTQVDLKAATGAAVLVWITDLGPSRADGSAFPFRVDIAELAVR